MADLSRSMRFFYGMLAALIPFILQYNYVLDMFYGVGAVYFDAGWFANLVWHNDFVLTESQFYGNFSYLGVHFSPLLVLLNQLSYFVITNKVEFYAFFIATMYASFSAAMYYALIACLRPARHWQVAGIAVLAGAFGFNGVILQGMWMPHFEYFIPVSIFLFLLHHRLGNRGYALFFFIFTLSLREDAGLHLVSFLGLLLCLDYLRRRSSSSLKRELIFLCVACAYSLLVWWITFRVRAFYNIGGSALETTYTGFPPYAHLSWKLLSERAADMFSLRVYLWLALLITLSWSLFLRNLHLLVAFVACVPWFLLNWTASYGYTGTLYAYYAFPFVLCMGWPPIAAIWRYGADLTFAMRRDLLLMQVMLVLAGFITWNVFAHRLEFGPISFTGEGSYRLTETEENRETIRRFTDALGRNNDLGVVMVDDGIGSLALGSIAQNKGRTVLWHTDNKPIDTLVYINTRSPHEMADRILQNRLQNHYCVIGTRICLFTSRTREKTGIFAPMIIESQVNP